jgi:vacuolar-type H+-ATPase subunit E/Vma4
MNGIEKITARIEQDARTEIEALLKEAEEKASRILDDAMEEQETIRQSLNNLKNSANAYRHSFLEMLDKHRQALEDTAGVFEEKQEG